MVIKDHVIDKASRERIMNKKSFVCKRHYSEDQRIRCMYKIISSLFLKKSLKVSCNSGKQACDKKKKFFLIRTTLEENEPKLC